MTPTPPTPPTPIPSVSALGVATQQIHHPYQPPAGFMAQPLPVYKASTVFFSDVKDLRETQWIDKSGYTYGLHGTPTTYALEERIATLEGGHYAVLAPSGLAVIALVDMAFLKTGDEVLIPDNAYSPNIEFAKRELASWGITYQRYDPMNPIDFKQKINEKTRLIWFEAAGSLSLEFPDIPYLVSHVDEINTQRTRPIITALDNTWGAGVAFCAFDWGVAISVQALTKYPSGGADVLMGSIVTQQADLHHAVLMCHARLGLNVGANDAELVLRGLSSIALRYHAQDAATRQLAHWVQKQPGVTQVLHPALADSPGHHHWQRYATAAACLFGVVFDETISQEKVDAFCDALDLFHLGWSWAGPMSLVALYDMASLRTASPWSYRGCMIRFAIGLEDVHDLQEDLAKHWSLLY